MNRTADAGADAPSYRWTVLSLLLATYLLNFLDRQIFSVLQEQIRADLGFNDLQLGLLGGTMFAVFYAIAGLPIAYLADRTHRVRVIAASCAAWSGFTALCGLAGGFVTMALARVGVAVGEAGGVSPSYSVLSDYFEPEKRGLALGLFSIGAPLGLAAGAAAGAAIAAVLGWRWAFILLGAPGLMLSLMILWRVREPERGRLDPTPDANAPAPRPLDALRIVWSTPSLRWITFGAAAVSFAGYGFFHWAPSFLQRSQGLTEMQIATMFAPTLVLGVAGSLMGGVLADRYGVKSPAAYGLIPGAAIVVAAPFLIASALVEGGRASIALISIPVLLNFMWIAPALAAAQNLATPHTRALVAAIMAFFNNLVGFGLGPLAVGAISHALTPEHGAAEALRVAMVCAAVAYALAGGFFLAAARTLPGDSARRALTPRTV